MHNSLVYTNRTAPAGNSTERVPTYRIRVFPIVFFGAYLFFTVLLFAYGPWTWPISDPRKLYGFVTLAYAALIVGYLLGIRRPARGGCRTWGLPRLVKISLVLNLLLLAPIAYHKTAGNIDLVRGLTNPGEAYLEIHARTLPSSWYSYVVVYAEMLLAPLTGLLLPLTIVGWRRLHRTLRYLALGTVLAGTSVYILMGVNKGLADFILVVPWLFWLANWRDYGGKSRTRVFLAGVAFVVLLSLFAVYLELNVAGRLGKESTEDIQLVYDVKVDRDNVFISYLPPREQAVALSLTAYVIHGYMGLANCLDEDFVWTFGAGHSRFLIPYAEKLLGLPDRWVFERTYPARVEQTTGYSANVRWHTIFPWLANDVTFPGAIFIMFLLGYGFARCWLDALRGVNVFAYPMLCYFLITMFYIPANNQVFQVGPSVIGFWVTLLLWRWNGVPAVAPRWRVAR